MMLSALFWMVCGLAALLVLSGWIMALQRNRRRELAGAEEQPMYASGVFSLIRKSPRELVLGRMPAPDVVATLIGEERGEAKSGNTETLPGKPGMPKVGGGKAEGVSKTEIAASSRVSEYLAEWRRVADLCIHNIELGDREGVQTYRYEVPARCGATCKAFGGDTYVTREQLHKNSDLIPPFHLGCGCIIVAKAAWEGGASSGRWSPLLPINGAYPLPDWRTVVPL